MIFALLGNLSKLNCSRLSQKLVTSSETLDTHNQSLQTICKVTNF